MMMERRSNEPQIDRQRIGLAIAKRNLQLALHRGLGGTWPLGGRPDDHPGLSALGF